MKRIEVFISEGNADRRLGVLKYDELRGKEVSSFELDGDFVIHPSVSLLVSNTDDHLRNHGFIAADGKWRLSPAYDLNANVKRPQSLSLELDAGVPIESIDTLLDSSDYFRLGKEKANAQLERIREQEEMSVCFTRG